MPTLQQPSAIRAPRLSRHPCAMLLQVRFPLLRAGKPRQRRRPRYKSLAGDAVPGVAQKERALYIRCLSVLHIGTSTKKGGSLGSAAASPPIGEKSCRRGRANMCRIRRDRTAAPRSRHLYHHFCVRPLSSPKMFNMNILPLFCRPAGQSALCRLCSLVFIGQAPRSAFPALHPGIFAYPQATGTFQVAAPTVLWGHQPCDKSPSAPPSRYVPQCRPQHRLRP